MIPPRRIITGLNADGQSCILIDESSEMVMWSTTGPKADNSHTTDAGGVPFTFPTNGTLLTYHDFPPGTGFDMHATDTIDYIIILSGQITFITETGEVLARAGDVIVDRGIMHGWRNDGDEACRVVNILCPAIPVGKGATVSGTFGN